MVRGFELLCNEWARVPGVEIEQPDKFDQVDEILARQGRIEAMLAGNSQFGKLSQERRGSVQQLTQQCLVGGLKEDGAPIMNQRPFILV